jgi:hypothetical protein
MTWVSSKAFAEKPDELSGMKRNALIYALSLGLVALALILRSVLAPTLGGQALYLFLVPPVLIAGVIGGIGPGLFTTAISLALHLYLTGEVTSLARTDSPLFASELWRARPSRCSASAWRGSVNCCSERAARRPRAKHTCNRFSTPFPRR